jgi:hypothetical protein
LNGLYFLLSVVTVAPAGAGAGAGEVVGLGGGVNSVLGFSEGTPAGAF